MNIRTVILKIIAPILEKHNTSAEALHETCERNTRALHEIYSLGYEFTGYCYLTIYVNSKIQIRDEIGIRFHRLSVENQFNTGKYDRDDTKAIEQGISNGVSFKDIAKTIRRPYRSVINKWRRMQKQYETMPAQGM